MQSAPLSGIRLVEFAGIGPAPYCATLLSDLGADVLRIDRLGTKGPAARDVHCRGRRRMCLDLKRDEDQRLAVDLLSRADASIEGFRPGVMERLGLGPERVLTLNPRLVYGRVTGWGRDGPLALRAGHDINYIGLSGALAGIGPAEGPPLPPLNLVGDFAGGSLFLALGMAAALLHVQRGGDGQVVDAAMVDGAASLMSFFTGALEQGWDVGRRGQNLLDGSAHYYRCYQCSDGQWLAVGAIEPQFYSELMKGLGIAESAWPSQRRESWAQGTALLQDIFRRRSRDEWCARFESTDACVTPVLEYDEAPEHPQARAREVFVEASGVRQAAPAPRLSETPARIQGPPPAEEDSPAAALARWPKR
ncbi:MAG: CoA transferase [Gammaproteobacteria bacterium]|nr:MAG: CoA transferase [Gammaproteobacteria bacterium]